ncbi:MAG: L-threonylcarbamoyladenylate synthase [Candidatus Thorarchaeota archaeon]
MTARIVRPTNEDEVKNAVSEAVEVLLAGGLVVYPTDTSYGLTCDPRNRDAFERLFDVKQRSRSIGLPLLFADVKQCEMYHDFRGLEFAITRLFWPGVLTLIVSVKEGTPEYLTGNRGSLAIRVPNHDIPRGIARQLDTPIAGTSANISGGPSPFDVSIAFEQLGDSVELYIDGGASDLNNNSTIVGVDEESDGFSSVKVYREGALSIEKLTESLQFDSDALRFWTNRIVYADM